MKKYIFFSFFILLEFTFVSNAQWEPKSPINIVHLREDSTITFPENPTFAFDRTTYYHINNKKFEAHDEDVTMDVPDMGKAYVYIYNQRVTYSAKKIAIKNFEENYSEGLGNDLEIQIYHELDGVPPKGLDKDGRDFSKLGISIKFTTIRDKTSKNRMIEQIVKVAPDQKMEFATNPAYYDFDYVSNLDFNVFTDFKDPYNYYFGKSTIKDITGDVNWIIFHRAQDMSRKEYRNLELAFFHNIGKIYNSQKPVCSTSTSAYLYDPSTPCGNIGINYIDPV